MARYIGSNGKEHIVTEMMDGHLHNALAKLERTEPHRSAEIEAMRAEVAKRDQAAKSEAS